ncbi:MAG: septal ring lytic transglycosylase RlpA family protein [Thermoanaerobaculia bacterium]
MKMRSPAVLLLLFVAYACSTNAPPGTMPDVMHGLASWYGEEFAGRTTANGEIFDPLQFTAAHRTLPFGSVVDVTNPKNSQTVRVRINDHGPYIGQRVIDLSYAAAQQIGLIEPGTGDVDIRVIKLGLGDREPPAPYEVKIQEPKEKVVIASGEPPRVDFPLPTQTTTMAVEVVEQEAKVDTRRQVSADGTKVEDVPIGGGPPIAAPAPAPAPPKSIVITNKDLVKGPKSSKPAATISRKLQYVVQVGAFSVEANAKALQAQLTKIGQQSFVDHESLYRVRIGPFATRDQAVKARTALETKGMSAIIVVE